MVGKQCLWLPGFFLNVLQVWTDVFLSLESLSSPLDAKETYGFSRYHPTLWLSGWPPAGNVVFWFGVDLFICLPLSQGLCFLHCISLEFWDLLVYTGDKINISSANQWVKEVPPSSQYWSMATEARTQAKTILGLAG